MVDEVLVERIRRSLLPDQRHPDDMAYHRDLIRLVLALADWHAGE